MSWGLNFTAATKEIAKREIAKFAESVGPDALPKRIADEMLESVDLVNLDPNPPHLTKTFISVSGGGSHYKGTTGGSGQGAHAFEIKAVAAPITE